MHPPLSKLKENKRLAPLPRGEAPMIFTSIHNYYEALVFDYLMNTLAREPDVDQDFLEDIACLTLNRLPTRYVRNDTDMAFSLSTRERERMHANISEAVLDAIRQLHEHQDGGT